MSKILDGIDPTEIEYVHIIADTAHPAFATAQRIPTSNCIVTPDYLEFTNAGLQGRKVRVDRKRIILVEWGKFVMPDPITGFDNDDDDDPFGFD